MIRVLDITRIHNPIHVYTQLDSKQITSNKTCVFKKKVKFDGHFSLNLLFIIPKMFSLPFVLLYVIKN